jgi:hypothetical protein
MRPGDAEGAHRILRDGLHAVEAACAQALEAGIASVGDPQCAINANTTTVALDRLTQHCHIF